MSDDLVYISTSVQSDKDIDVKEAREMMDIICLEQGLEVVEMFPITELHLTRQCRLTASCKRSRKVERVV